MSGQLQREARYKGHLKWFISVVAVLHSNMRDSEVVAAIVVGDPEGLAEAYDRYASPLYTYCRSLLREPADAADAVQDTFVIAASRLAGLRDRNRLRPWLYAVARNECHRRLRARANQVTTPLESMPDVTDISADVSGEAEREELRALLRAAVRGLNTGEQDLIELQLRQGLDAAEIAAVLGVSRNHAHALLSRARDQLEISLGALLVARSGRQDCAALNTMLADWDGQLTVLMRKRINRHIENCPVCAERKQRELAPALLGLAPLVALPIAAMPPGLRAHVLRLASSNTPEALAHRASVAQRTGPFGQHGFPKPLDPPKSPWWRARHGQAAAGAAAAAVVAGTIVAVALAGGGQGQHGGAAALGTSAAPGASTGATSGSGPGGTGPGPVPPTAANGVRPASPAPAAAGGPAPTAGGSPSGAPAGAGSPSGGPSPSGGSTPSAPRPGPTATASSSSASAPGTPAPSTSAASTPPPPAPGTLSVSARTILVSVGRSATITMTASGGPVTWSITESSSLIGGLAAAPSSGTLASGQSVTITVSASDLLTVGGQLTVNPGGITVSVVVGTGIG